MIARDLRFNENVDDSTLFALNAMRKEYIYFEGYPTEEDLFSCANQFEEKHGKYWNYRFPELELWKVLGIE